MSAAPRVALVTGGGRGIGRACAQRLARDGFHVVIVDRQGADAAASEIAAGAEAETCDLAAPEAVAALAERVLARHGRCDVLVNNAAHLGMHRFGELDLETWRRFQAVNVEAPFLLCAVLVPAMAREGHGRIVNIVSNTFWDPPPLGMVPYVASKGALLGLTRSLANEVGASGITVNAVAPGLTRTEATSGDVPEEHFAAVRDQQALPRTLVPEDIAGAVAFLASDAAAMITGQALRVDGGRVTL